LSESFDCLHEMWKTTGHDLVWKEQLGL